ncbi:tubulin-specific chaperone A-like [Accipiter gentilis]|uniref:tubulin-specific chaperone A-like n=1 Tax=Astur gentilis TaxID=8957 RepID=UPI002110410F|nr:tubulin-specific chaperone A-like [Accipiter gentilis]
MKKTLQLYTSGKQPVTNCFPKRPKEPFCLLCLKIEILQESRMMIPDCQRRLEVAHADLVQLLENEKELEEAEEYKEARSILESVKLEA